MGSAPQEKIAFISQSILERLKFGAFVPARKTRAGQLYRAGGVSFDRRDNYSLLAITKRCIHYDPSVFDYRKDHVTKLAETLNRPDKKLILVGGTQGIGKTSLVRGAVELMGGGKEQVLWFDANRHSDYEEIIQFLVQYIIYLSPNKTTGGIQEPFEKLDRMIRTMTDMPLLLVVDNMEYLVDSSLRLHSQPFKEVLNFLLKYANIKMVLIGERLPYADLNASLGIVEEFKLTGLSEEATVMMMHRRSREVLHDDQPLKVIYRLTSGYPWLLKALVYLHQKTTLSFQELTDRLLEQHPTTSPFDLEKQAQPIITPIEVLMTLLIERLSDVQKKALHLMIFLRHPMDVTSLNALIQFCYPDLPFRQIEEEMSDFEHSVLRPVMKITYPPQDVIHYLRQEQRQQSPTRFKPWFELYVSFKKIAYKQVSDFERVRIHEVLYEYYRLEKDRDKSQVRLKTSALVAEARFHQQMLRKRKPFSSVGEKLGFPSPEGSDDATEENTFDLPVVPDYRQPSAVSPAETTAVFYTPATDMSAAPERIPIRPEDLTGVKLSDEEKQLLSPMMPIANSVPIAEDQNSPSQAHSSQAISSELHVPVTAVTDLHDPIEKEIQQKLATAVTSHNRPELFRQLLALTEHRMQRQRYDAAADCLEKALGLQGLTGEMISDVYRLQGRLKKATYHHNDALMLLKKARRTLEEYIATQHLSQPLTRQALKLAELDEEKAEIFEFRKHYPEAIAAYQRAITLIQQQQDIETSDRTLLLHIEATLCFKLANLLDQASQPEQAIQAYRQVLSVITPHSGLRSEFLDLALFNLGSLYTAQGQWHEAVRCFQEVLSHEVRGEHWEARIQTLNALAYVYQEQNKWPEAEKYCQEALAVAIQHGSSLARAECYLNLGLLYATQQSWDNALKHYQWARDVAQGELSQSSLEFIESKIQEIPRVVDP